MSRPTAIVATTIFEPKFLAGFEDSLSAFGRLNEVRLYVIPDHKTPSTVSEAAAAARERGFRVICPSLAEQDEFLKRLGAPSDFIPYNSDNRRNVGFLMALDAGCEVLISIDDDNFALPGEDFIGGHHVVGSSSSDPQVRSSDRWFNICSLLESDAGKNVFPRGFPYAAQNEQRTISFDAAAASVPIAMNAGLWLDEPDVDAACRLTRRPKITGFAGPNVVLGPEVWSPINTQNTSLTREAALTYYYIRMGFPLQGLRIDRFGDILSGYLTQKVIKHLGHGIRIGTPILDHRRTPHNLFKDLYHELAGMVLIEEFVPWLQDVKLSGSTPLAAYAALAEEMTAMATRPRGFVWDEGGREFIAETAGLMQTWVRIVQQFGG
ncbi:MAG TPA: hypothetical protein VFG20_23410 [Planctomycetaceae bacterium]|nr:hypothetical protein [Planctomycetaceae bacterium]